MIDWEKAPSWERLQHVAEFIEESWERQQSVFLAEWELVQNIKEWADDEFNYCKKYGVVR